MKHVAQTHPHLAHHRLYIGDVRVSDKPAVLETLLGSCVSVCLYDPVLGFGGMNHILLSHSSRTHACQARCGVHAMELLVNGLMAIGCDRRRFVAKAFGGGNVLPTFQAPTVGDLNIEFVHRFLEAERIPLVGERLGGTQAVRVLFFTDSGKARVYAASGQQLDNILHSETVYFNKPPSERFPAGEVEIF